MARKSTRVVARPGPPKTPRTSPEAGDFGTVIRRSQIVLCCGTGGVGKTTTAAALALAGAEDGRRCVVVTIDPAKRLADALGLDSLTNRPTKVSLPDLPGEVWALMLDTKATFDDLVRRHAPSPAQAERILANGFYKNISGALGGTQEYMATEKLYELVNEPVDDNGLPIPRFDLIVVDTPPTRNALDFVSAPTRLTRLLDNRVFRALMAPARSGLRVFGAASQLVLRGIGKVIGGEVLADAVAFFQSFEGMEAGFRDRAQAVLALLKEPSTGWILITTPRQEAVDEAVFFGTELLAHELAISGVVANRMYPEFGLGSGQDRTGVNPSPAIERVQRGASLAAAHREALQPLRTLVGTAPWALVPLADHDLHDLGELRNFARELMRT